MLIIKINILNKLPKVVGNPLIVCGNKDYKIKFVFDEEWSGTNIKTARFIWKQNGETMYADAPFDGDTVAVPMLMGTQSVSVGVYAGDLHTTAAAKILCVHSVLCDSEDGILTVPPEFPQPIFSVEQDLTEKQKAQARENIGAAAVGEGGGGTGEEGFSPIAKVTQTADGAVIEITDKVGTTTATITNGKDGADGKDGRNGVDGEDGKDGIDGTNGADGVGIAKTEIVNGELVITYTDGKIENLGKVVGEDGKDGVNGEKGDKGDKGDPGEPGQPGADGKDGESGVYVGSGEMPEDCNVQIDPDGEVTTFEDIAQEAARIVKENNNYYRATDYGISTDAESNTLALQSLIDDVSAKGGGIIFFPVGTYNFKQQGSSNYRWAVEMKSNVSIIGENIEKTVLKQTEEKPYSLFGRILDNGGGATEPLTGCVFKNFTVDAYATGNVNNVCGKAFFFQYVRDCVFRDLILRGTVATALGIDFLDRVVIDNVSCIDCGRTFTGNEAGTSGIGIGTAGWENENFIITNCICVGSGQYGIFIENQGIFYEGNVPYAKGSIIANCIVRNGINKGIGVRGGQNVTIIGCESYENTSHGIFIDNNCKNVKVLSCSSANNGGAGIFMTPNNTEHLLIKGCTFVNNQAEGIKVSVDVGKNANKLCIQDCYTDGNTIGMDLSANYLSDCVILGNATLDGINNSTTFTGNTAFNNLINAVDPDTPSEPTVQNIIVPYSSMSNGKKLMPDGSIADGVLNATFATEGYINVSRLSDTFILRYPDTVGCSIRIAQYDGSQTSLSTSFGLDGPTETANGYQVWKITKLDGCQYIRIFVSGSIGGLSGELCNVV